MNNLAYNNNQVQPNLGQVLDSPIKAHAFELAEELTQMWE